MNERTYVSLYISYEALIPCVEVYHPHLSAGAGEPRWLQEEKDNFQVKLDKNGDGKLDKVCNRYYVSRICTWQVQ